MNIVLYTKNGCPWCRGVLDLLKSNNIPFEEREVTTNKEYFDEMIKKSNQTKTPTLDIDGYILADSDKDQVREYLLTKGVKI